MKIVDPPARALCLDPSYYQDAPVTFHWAELIHAALTASVEFEARQHRRGKGQELHPIVALVRLEARSRR